MLMILIVLSLLTLVSLNYIDELIHYTRVWVLLFSHSCDSYWKLSFTLLCLHGVIVEFSRYKISLAGLDVF